MIDLRPVVFSELVKGRRLILEHFRPDSCIASTRIGLEVLRHFSLPAEALAVTCYASTPKLWERVKKGKFTHPFRKGEWSVGIGFGADARRPDPENSFDGHVILVSASLDKPAETIIDLSLDQCARPERGMRLHAHATEIPLEWRTENLAIEIAGCWVSYKPVARSFEHSGDWNMASPRGPVLRQVAAKIIHQIKLQLSA